MSRPKPIGMRLGVGRVRDPSPVRFIISRTGWGASPGLVPAPPWAEVLSSSLPLPGPVDRKAAVGDVLAARPGFPLLPILWVLLWAGTCGAFRGRWRGWD
jgi:hypothetical protein